MDKVKVLVVDDNPMDLKLASRPFLSMGYDLITATNGEDALKKAASEHPDLIVLDVIIPKINGFKVCRQIKNSTELRDIKIIMLSGKNQESDKYWGEKQGADCYITKPFTEEDLLNTAAKLL